VLVGRDTGILGSSPLIVDNVSFFRAASGSNGGIKFNGGIYRSSIQGGIRGESSGKAGGGASISYGIGAGGNALSVCIGDEMSSGNGLSRRAEAEMGSGFDRCSYGTLDGFDRCGGGT